MKKILFSFNELKATFWFVPVLIIVLSILLATGTVILDEFVSLPQDGLGRFFFVNSAASARSILTTISGAMIGVAGTVFSVTLVALTLASSQFGPRLIKNFMYVRLNQVVLGSYVATYLYCLLVLNAIKGSDSFTFIPSISILLAIAAAFVNIILLIVFIHNIAISIQADKVISDVSDIMSNQIKRLFPTEIGDETNKDFSGSVDQLKENCSFVSPILSPKNGYLQYIDTETLLEIVSSHNGLFELNFRPGDHLVEDIEVGKLYSIEEIDEKVLERLQRQFVVGKTKNAQQDIEFSIHQMVEIAARALSPGVNDPYTAIACIDNLKAMLCKLTQVNFPSKYRVDEEKNLRIIAETFDFNGLLSASFNQIRQFSAGSPAVIIRLMEALITINKFTEKEDYKRNIAHHAQMVLNVGKDTIKEASDLNDLLERSKSIL
ncbi:DUF2254 domain-containing protein [Portibacter lacus]|uniref:DUF2254 domain-containing protein n=1 Tax=Portibacter lacus TaxID=1099794 RepID=A0AA37SMZ8_9BACT|nr:DUF2254 domain-containing protein [Portibacter lacus]GLR16026.1 hypothetical protein GCM10007940_06410 [Portibacter lacus]